MKNKLFVLLLLIIFVFSYDVYAGEKIKVTLDSCVNGDTANFIINKKVKKVRFIGIDTPESVKKDSKVEPYGKAASDYTCKKLKNAKKIEIEYDPKSDKKDKYDRVLAWVYVDSKLFQKELVEKGYAEVKYLYDNYLYADELKKSEAKAKNKKLRIWSGKKQEEDVNEKIMNSIDSFFDKIKRKIAKFIKSVL